MPLATPDTLKIEHEELHEALAAATKLPGKLGEAARGVARVLHPHFVKEEELAMPLLGMLPELAAGDPPRAERAAIVAMAGRLRRELPHMLAEHEAIVAALDALVAAAAEVHDAERAAFAQKLKLHARTEEQVLYPAALLVGDLAQLRGGAAAAE